MGTRYRPPGAADFDFLLGNWQVTNHRLKERLAGCDQWDSFVATLEARSILGGLGNVDRLVTTRGDRYFEGVTLRIFNPGTDLWSLYWVDNQRATLQAPLVGRFQDGIGEFLGDDRHAKIPVRVRFLWRDITDDSARWEQAFSVDGGTSWEINWVMEFTRVPAPG